MKVASSGSRRPVSSASPRIRAQTGSTFSIVPALTCRWAMIVSRIRSQVSLAQFDRVISVVMRVYGDCAAEAGGALTTIKPAQADKTTAGKAARMGASCAIAKSSRLLREKAQHRRLERLISHRQHVISPRDVERPAARQQRHKLVRRARNHVLGADRD